MFSKRKKIAFLLCFAALMFAYSAGLLFFSLPDNPIYLENDIEPVTIPRFLRQEWTLFAPTPIKNSYRVIIHCDNGEIIDPISRSISEHTGLNFFSKEYYVFMNLTDYLFESLSFESARLCKTEELCSLAVYSFKKSIEFQDFKNSMLQFCGTKNRNIENLKIEFTETKYPMFSKSKNSKPINRIMIND